MKLTIFLARHGETDWNAELRLQGWTDISLNQTGRHQAANLSKQLMAHRLDAIYCSALNRSKETADVVGRALNTPVVVLAELNEQSLGKYEGVILKGEVEREFHNRRSDPDDSLDGGESRTRHAERVAAAIDLIRKRHPDGGQVLIVGHGGTNNMILKTLFADMHDVTFRFKNSDLFVIELDGDSARYRQMMEESL